MQTSKAALVLAVALGTAHAGEPSAAEPETPDTRDTVFEFRPRIIAPEGADGTGPQDPLSLPSFVHLHIYKQPVAAGDCDRGRQYVDGAHVGVVLSGGISKGLAFIGALEVIDKVGIRVDKIVGTSMGAVVGAFYAAGYSPTQLYAEAENGNADEATGILTTINWRTLFTDIPDVRSITLNQQMSWGLGEGSTALPRVYQGGLRSGQNLSSFLGKYLLAATAASNGCFDNLYVPFRASATNVSGSDTDPLRDGELATAVRASLSFPVLLTPTYINGKRYIDGGILNNYPINTILDLPARTDAITAAAARKDKTQYAAILGFDVSDTSTSLPRHASLFQIATVYDAISGINDGIGAAISRETELSRNGQEDCLAQPDPNAKLPCLFHTKFHKDGGFTDFSKGQIQDFVSSGRATVIDSLCETFVIGSLPGCVQMRRDSLTQRSAWSDAGPKARAAIERTAIAEISDALRVGPWKTLLHDPKQTLDNSKAALKALQLPATLDAFGRALGDNPAGLPRTVLDANDEQANVLEGLQVASAADGSIRVQVSAALSEHAPLVQQLLDDVRRAVRWLAFQLRQPNCTGPECAEQAAAGLPGFKELANLRVRVGANGLVVVRASTWKYQMRGLVTTRGLTERGALTRASVDFWNVEPAQQQRLLHKFECMYRQRPRQGLDVPCEQAVVAPPVVVPGSSTQKAATSYGLSNGQARAPDPPGPWKAELFQALRNKGNALDVRYFASRPGACPGATDAAACPDERSLPYVFEGYQERYYSNAAAEHFRIDGIRAGVITVAEKDTSRTAGGSIYGSYQYDYRNKHTLGAKYVYETANDRWFKPTRVVTTIAANEPAAEVTGMRLIDARFLYFPSVEPMAPDYSFNPYSARRNQRIGYGIPRFKYDETGLTATVSWRSQFASLEAASRAADTPALTPYVSASYRRIGDASASNIDAVRSLLQDPGIDERRRNFASAYGGATAAQYLEQLSFLEQLQLAVHRADGYTFTETILDASVEGQLDARPDSPIIGTRFYVGRITHGRKQDRPDASRPPPMDELYSLGGYYPLADRSIWGRKRIDYLGADLNQRWGTRLYLLELRRSLVRWVPVTYFAPYAKVQVDVVVQRANIGFATDTTRAWRTAAGFVASGYAPSLSSIKPRLSAAIGGESMKHLRFFSSAEILF